MCLINYTADETTEIKDYVMNDYFVRDIQALYYSKSMIPNMRRLSAPLFSNTKITNFSYLRFNKNGTILNLTTEEKWIQFRFEQKIKYKILFKDHLEGTKYDTPYTYLWPKNTDEPLLGALHQYNIWNGCNIYIPNRYCIEVFSFASTIENEIIQNFYINNLDLLRAYIIFFKEQIRDFPNNNSKYNLISTDLTLPTLISTKSNSRSTFYSMYNNSDIKRFHIAEDLYLTKKELECCAYFMSGFNIKEIAQIKKLSPRTIETHFNNIKLKANCPNKKKLIDFLSNKKWIFDAILNAQ